MTQGSPCPIAHGPLKIGEDCNRVPPRQFVAEFPRHRDREGTGASTSQNMPGDGRDTLIMGVDYYGMVTQIGHNITYILSRTRGHHKSQSLREAVLRAEGDLTLVVPPYALASLHPDPLTTTKAVAPQRRKLMVMLARLLLF
jgi:hypothetical protein